LCFLNTDASLFYSEASVLFCIIDLPSSEAELAALLLQIILLKTIFHFSRNRLRKIFSYARC